MELKTSACPRNAYRSLLACVNAARYPFCNPPEDFSERVRQVQAGEEVDTATRQWIVDNCDVCPGCKAVVYRDAGCKSITCPCEARFTHGEHRLST